MGSHGGSGLSKLGLDLVGVDDSGEIGAVHHTSVEGVVALLLGVLGVASEDVVESLEGILGEDHESSEVSTWGELEDVESVHVACVNSWQVSGGQFDSEGVISEHDQWSLSHDVSGASVFTNTGSGVL